MLSGWKPEQCVHPLKNKKKERRRKGEKEAMREGGKDKRIKWKLESS